MKTTQEEAANMNVHQVADVKATEVLVVVDNTVSIGFTSVGRCHSNFDLSCWFRQFV